MKKFPATLLCGLAAMLLTIVLYFTILGNIVLTAIHFICLIAILISEALTTLYAWKCKGSPRKLAAAVVSALLVPYAIVLSVVYIINFPEGYGTYIGWYVAGVLVVNILAFILMRFDNTKAAENTQLQDAKGNMLKLRKLVKCIMADPAAKSYEARLYALEEKLHFSNDAVIVPEDADIRALLLQLQENIADPEFDHAQLLDKLEKLVDRRKIMA